jgi:quaternary ammonium compound-resistance protein SugE
VAVSRLGVHDEAVAGLHTSNRLGHHSLAMVASFALLSVSMRTLPLGTAYTVWTGIDAVGAFLVGILVLGEPLNMLRVIAATLIVSGLILMHSAAS